MRERAAKEGVKVTRDAAKFELEIIQEQLKEQNQLLLKAQGSFGRINAAETERYIEQLEKRVERGLFSSFYLLSHLCSSGCKV